MNQHRLMQEIQLGSLTTMKTAVQYTGLADYYEGVCTVHPQCRWNNLLEEEAVADFHSYREKSMSNFKGQADFS